MGIYDTYGLKDERKKFIDLILYAAKTKEILKMSKGDQEISYTYVDDVVSAVMQASKMFSKIKDFEKKYSVYNDKEIMSLAMLVRRVEEVLSIKIENDFGFYPYRENKIMKVLPSYSPLPNWQPKVFLKEGIQKKWNEINQK